MCAELPVVEELLACVKKINRLYFHGCCFIIYQHLGEYKCGISDLYTSN